MFFRMFVRIFSLAIYQARYIFGTNICARMDRLHYVHAILTVRIGGGYGCARVPKRFHYAASRGIIIFCSACLSKGDQILQFKPLGMKMVSTVAATVARVFSIARVEGYKKLFPSEL